MDCREYIIEYLAAQADDELAPEDRRAANEHLEKCAACRARLAEERSLKALVSQNAGIVRTPADVRLRIRAALGDLADTNLERQPNHANRIGATRADAAARGGSAENRESAIGRDTGHRLGRLSRRGLWASVGGAAAALILIVAIIAGRATNGTNAPRNLPVPAFDMAIGKYLSFERNFTPNVPSEAYSNQDGAVYAWVQSRDPVKRVTTEASDTFDDIARSYREVNMPDDLFDFTAAGYSLTGGRVEHLPDGRPITYTLYASDTGAILSICFRDSSMAAPIGAINWLGMRSFYEYKGYSICMSFYPTGHFVSILISPMPANQMIRDVAMTDASVVGK